MCVEIYSLDQPIQIPYEHENIRFLSPTSFRATYTLLVRNAGFRPIDALLALYPRLLYHLTLSTGKARSRPRLRIDGFENTTESLLSHHPEMVRRPDGRLELALPDPNNPVCQLPALVGRWDHDNVQAQIPEVVLANARRAFWAFEQHRFSVWALQLTEGIAPGDAHWFQCEIEVEGAGEPLEDTLYGPVIFHELASPIDVRRTVAENLQNALRDVWQQRATIPPSEADYHEQIATLGHQERALTALVSAFGLAQERRVDIQYYELTLETGDPREQFLVYAFTQGDIRMRSGSPRLGRHPELDRGRIGEPVYEWKSGSILEPAHPWRNTGFSLRIGLGCRRSFFESV